MIAYSCNIACAGCISISDRKRDGVASIDDISAWVTKWSSVIDPKLITIFGGEPCIHPKLIEICQLIRTKWPNSIIRLITNGYLLDNFSPSDWFKFDNFEMQISLHRQDHRGKIDEQIKKILLEKKNWQIKMYGGDDHKQISWTNGNFTIYKSIFKDFVVPYKQVEDTLLPWHSDPSLAHKICGSPSMPILYKGHLYKCPAVANAMDISGKNWFNYQPLDIDGDIEGFISSIGKPEPVCGQCPSQQQAVIINHFDKKNVKVRTKNIN
jgi:hypothetical protein